MEDKKIKLVFAPGCFDDFDGSQEELDDIIEEINRQIDTGEFFENAVEITDDIFDDLPENDQDKLVQYFEGELKPRRLH